MPSEVTRRDTVKKSGQLWDPSVMGQFSTAWWVQRVHARLANRKGEGAHRQAPPCRLACRNADGFLASFVLWRRGDLSLRSKGGDRQTSGA